MQYRLGSGCQDTQISIGWVKYIKVWGIRIGLVQEFFFIESSLSKQFPNTDTQAS